MENVCRFSKFGYCKYKENCRKIHFNEICKETRCATKSCSKRHPKMCRFFQFYGNCKFGEFCHYNHDLKENNCGSSERIDKLEKTVTDFKMKLQESDNLLKQLDSEILSLQKQSQLQKLQVQILSDEFATYASASDNLEGKVKDMDEEFDMRISSAKSLFMSTVDTLPQLSGTVNMMREKIKDLETQNMGFNKAAVDLQNTLGEVEKRLDTMRLMEKNVDLHMSQQSSKGRVSRFRPPP